MSRVSILEQLYSTNKKGALDFDYDALWAPPLLSLLTPDDINRLYKIATSLKYNGRVEKKYELIDAIMVPRGFKRGNRGTNRVVYNFLNDTSFCVKIAIDRVGMKDSPAEYKNQEFFKPFCCKIFEVDPTGTVALIERVNPISTREEFASVIDDVFNMMITKIIGKYVVDDLGVSKFMNYGVRYKSNGVAFGPVILDFPYAYELDGAKLKCGKLMVDGDPNSMCCGEIDYDDGMDNLICTKCGKKYAARELAKEDSGIIKYYTASQMAARPRCQVVRESDGKVILDTGRVSKLYLSLKQFKEVNTMLEFEPVRKVVKTTVEKRKQPLYKARYEYHMLQNRQRIIDEMSRPMELPEKSKVVKTKKNVAPVEQPAVNAIDNTVIVSRVKRRVVDGEVDNMTPEVVTAVPVVEDPIPEVITEPAVIETSVEEVQPIVEQPVMETPVEEVEPLKEDESSEVVEEIVEPPIAETPQEPISEEPQTVENNPLSDTVVNTVEAMEAIAAPEIAANEVHDHDPYSDDDFYNSGRKYRNSRKRKQYEGGKRKGSRRVKFDDDDDMSGY